MAVHPDVEALLRIAPPEHRGEERIDWAAAEAALGTRLPSDYTSFMDTYGVGDIGELVILPPLPVDVPNLSDCHIGSMSEGLRWVWEKEGGVPGVSAGPEDVLPWGTGCNANEMAWLTTDADPDKWPVVTWRRQVSYGESRWAIFDCGMVKFLTRMMLAEFDECPLGDASLWGRPGAFVSWREQRRRLVAGLDPLTGEPDPYAEMFPIFDE
ncbi:hypothetical protein AB0D49_41060 [Streptomyces sp. NPDC048290]|uniref:SMI1/KNR4 family protein n=1 Tax=Streptomyces sp. NPDC048290 TaxID=3155811 RepID=UPI003444D3F6